MIVYYENVFSWTSINENIYLKTHLIIAIMTVERGRVLLIN